MIVMIHMGYGIAKAVIHVPIVTFYWIAEDVLIASVVSIYDKGKTAFSM
jgi:hypothetical protein